MRGSNARAVIARLNPIIRGWAAYYRGVVSSKVFSALDNYMWQLTCRWARRSHPNKPKKWIARRYFGRFNKFRNDRWVFGDPRRVVDDRGDIAYLVKFSWTPIVRHQLVTGGASPRRPRPDPLLGRTAAKGQTPVGQLQPAPARQAGRALPALRGPPAHRRSAPAVPARVGTMVAERRQAGDRRRLPHPPRARRRTGREPNPPGTRLLPSQPPGPRCAGAQHRNPQRPRGLLEPCAGKARSHGSEGGPAQQCAGPTRHEARRGGVKVGAPSRG